MTGRTRLILAALGGGAVGLVVLLLLFLLVGSESCATRPEGEEPADGPSGGLAEGVADLRVIQDGEPVTPTDLRPVALFFATGRDFLLLPEARNIFWTATVADRARQVVVELMRGPLPDGRLRPSVPDDLALREVYVLPDGTAWVDLTTSGRRLHLGSLQEWVAVEGLALSLTANFPEIERVGLLIEGEMIESLGGHLDLRRTYTGMEWLPAGVRLENLLPPEVSRAQVDEAG